MAALLLAKLRVRLCYSTDQDPFLAYPCKVAGYRSPASGQEAAEAPVAKLSLGRVSEVGECQAANVAGLGFHGLGL